MDQKKTAKKRKPRPKIESGKAQAPGERRRMTPDQDGGWGMSGKMTTPESETSLPNEQIHARVEVADDRARRAAKIAYDERIPLEEALRRVEEGT